MGDNRRDQSIMARLRRGDPSLDTGRLHALAYLGNEEAQMAWPKQEIHHKAEQLCCCGSSNCEPFNDGHSFVHACEHYFDEEEMGREYDEDKDCDCPKEDWVEWKSKIWPHKATDQRLAEGFKNAPMSLLKDADRLMVMLEAVKLSFPHGTFVRVPGGYHSHLAVEIVCNCGDFKKTFASFDPKQFDSQMTVRQVRLERRVYAMGSRHEMPYDTSTYTRRHQVAFLQGRCHGCGTDYWTASYPKNYERFATFLKVFEEYVRSECYGFIYPDVRTKPTPLVALEMVRAQGRYEEDPMSLTALYLWRYLQGGGSQTSWHRAVTMLLGWIQPTNIKALRARLEHLWLVERLPAYMPQPAPRLKMPPAL